MRAPWHPGWALAIASLGFSGLAVAGEGPVAMQTADSSCPSCSRGEVHNPCSNGTVTDYPRSGGPPRLLARVFASPAHCS